jgi:hypothetical protein
MLDWAFTWKPADGFLARDNMVEDESGEISGDRWGPASDVSSLHTREISGNLIARN